ncbi:MAG: methylenetetrahydrofolate--tRNA-(uracil(54)-C(5))-methyltransferase (FADH(2)-oxidizing) TrmFO, partial [Acidobacteriota bacterium]
LFAAEVARAITSEARIEVAREEAQALPEGPAIIATGPLTSPPLHAALEARLGEGSLAFFDAIAPVVAADSLDLARLFRASRYGTGGGDDYLNAPLTRPEYERFVVALLAAERVPLHDFETDTPYFEGCLPIEVMAERGPDTLRFGPMKPVGLTDPRTGRPPWAVVQLRRDDLGEAQWNLVGFQTRMTIPAQKSVLQMIPGLENARFARFGMVHRNTFVCAPRHLDARLRLAACPGLRLAGQLTGVEGYVESAATGLLAGLFLACELAGGEPAPPPGWTAHGGLIRHLTERPPHRFQPANASWGLMLDPPLELPREKGARRRAAAAAALAAIGAWRSSLQV